MSSTLLGAAWRYLSGSIVEVMSTPLATAPLTASSRQRPNGGSQVLCRTPGSAPARRRELQTPQPNDTLSAPAGVARQIGIYLLADACDNLVKRVKLDRLLHLGGGARVG